jgi:hypothetical protein
VVDVEVVLGHDPKGGDGGQRAAILAIQLVDTVTKRDQLALLPTRQVEIAHQPTRGHHRDPFVVHARPAVLTPSRFRASSRESNMVVLPTWR